MVKEKIKKRKVSEERVIDPITPKIIKEFVGDVKHHEKTDCVHLYANRYRVNIWTRKEIPGRLVDEFKIVGSYFVALEDGALVDKTIKEGNHVESH